MGDLSVDALLEKHRKGMERLAAIDRTLIGGTADLASRQTALAQDALHEAASTLQSLAQGKFRTDALTKQAELSMRAIENALSHLRAVTEAVTGIAPEAKKDSSSEP
ncbi:MAG: phasin family protein [Chromatiaceae bacterium]|nr:phasin family protein [Chromatiaceae bacterium]